MNYCDEFMELISAYADGETTESDRQSVEEHLSECEGCSALLDLYREISVCADETCVPAPEALCTGVMEKVLSDDMVRATDSSTSANVSGRKNIRPMLLRYTPIAACLAILLIALPWIINNFSRLSFDALAPEPSAFRSADIPMEEMADNDAAMEESMLDTGNGVMAAGDAPFGLYENDYDGEAEDPQFEQAVPAPVDAPEIAMEGDNGQEKRDGTDQTGMNGSNQVASNILELLSYYSDAYVFIEIIGELPELLRSYDPQPLNDWLDWDEYYILPRAAAQELIGLIGEREGVIVMDNYEDSNYAVILYSSGV